MILVFLKELDAVVCGDRIAGVAAKFFAGVVGEIQRAPNEFSCYEKLVNQVPTVMEAFLNELVDST